MEPTPSEKLASAIEALRRCQERSMAGLFALEVMHEIRNPLDALGSLVYLAAGAQSLTLVHEYMRAAKEQTGEILQVISNLIGNALDALPQKGTLSIRVRKRFDRISLVVADNGHGISPDNLGRLFQPFFTTKNDQGNGLGLALSRKIVERHGGSIRARSSMHPGKAGATFLVDLPIVDGTHAAS